MQAIVLLAPSDQLCGDAAANYQVPQHCEFPIIDLSAVSNVASALSREIISSNWLVDAMLGTGATGEPRELYASAIL